MASANGNDGVVVVLILLVAVMLFVLLKSNSTPKTDTAETKFDNITVKLESKPVEKESVKDTQKTDVKKKETKVKKDAEFFIEQMRRKEANVASMQTPKSFLILYDVSSVPAKRRARDTTEFSRFSSKLSRLANLRSPSDERYDDANMNAFHAWESAVSKTDQDLLKQLPLSDQTHNNWYKAAVNFNDGKRPCSNVTICLNQLTDRMRKTVAKINVTDKAIIEERLLVDLLLCFFEIYSLIVLHEECCSIGAALSRDTNAKETLRTSFAETWEIVSRRFFSWFNRVPSLIPAMGLLQRGNENVCSMLSRLIDQRGQQLLPKILYGAQVVFLPLSTTVPTFLRDSIYTRISPSETLVHVHTDKELTENATNTTAKKMSRTSHDVWFQSEVRTDNIIGTCVNESNRPLPHVFSHNIETTEPWPTLGKVMSSVEQDSLFNVETLNHLVGKIERNESTHFTATDAVFVCQNSRLVSLNDHLEGVSSAQRFTSYERGVEQELIINSFLSQTATSDDQPTLVLNLLLSSTLKKVVPSVPITASVTVFNLCSLPFVNSSNYKQAYILSAEASSTSSSNDKAAFLDDTHCVLRIPHVDPNFNTHVLVTDSTIKSRVFIKRNQSNTTRTSMFLRLSNVGNLQLLVVQRLVSNNSNQETLDRITVGLGDQEYGSTVKAFDRKIRYNERSFLQSDETFDYANIDSYTNSMKRNCLNFLYS